MPHYQPLDNPADSDEPAIDLESSGIIDIEHARVCGGNADSTATPQRLDIVEPQASHRCQTSDREILRSKFADI